jgi:hypothetical protein
VRGGSDLNPVTPTVTRFVVIASPRTGSNYLCSLLDSHPDVICHHELFNPKGIHYALGWRDDPIDLGSVAERDADPGAFVRRVWAHDRGHHSVGFKLGIGHPPAAFEEVYSDGGVRRIVLSRRNRVKAYVSEQIAATEGRWTHYDTNPADVVPLRVRVDAGALLEWTNAIDVYYDEVRSRVVDGVTKVMEVDYEDLFSTDTEESVLRFLNLFPAPEGLSARTLKRNSDNLRDVVENYDELVDRLEGTPLGSCFTEGRIVHSLPA